MSYPPTITVPVAAKLLDISASSAYAAARKGNFPTKVIQIGGRYVVPTKPLLGFSAWMNCQPTMNQ